MGSSCSKCGWDASPSRWPLRSVLLSRSAIRNTACSRSLAASVMSEQGSTVNSPIGGTSRRGLGGILPHTHGRLRLDGERTVPLGGPGLHLGPSPGDEREVRTSDVGADTRPSLSVSGTAPAPGGLRTVRRLPRSRCLNDLRDG